MKNNKRTTVTYNSEKCRTKRKKTSKVPVILALHLLLCIYSVTGILSKLAAGTEFLSLQFVLLYGGVILILVVYAIGWQQILKHMPLTAAFANKAVTVIWGLVWGVMFFCEPITPGKIIGALLVIAGIVLYSLAAPNNSTNETGAYNG